MHDKRTFENCPCHSQKSYQECCEPFHLHKKNPASALELMRSRYCAYVLGDADYIIFTTHPQNPTYLQNKEQWKEQIKQFSKSTRFADLKILASSQQKNSASVTFFAILFQGSKNLSFIEESQFKKENGLWLYHSGKILPN